MNTTWKAIVGLPGVVFVAIGLIWLVAPGFAASQLGMTLLTGVGLSTQIGDLASFFLVMGGSILIALYMGQRVWLYPPVMLLGFAAFGRVVAWAFHGAAFAIDMIAVEVIVAGLLFMASKKLA
jgi:hypothetical protein